MSVNHKNFIKSVSYSFSANIISLFLGALATLLFPKFLQVSGYGYYQLYIFYTGFLIITALGISDGVQLKIAGKRYDSLDFEEQCSLFWFSTLTQIIIYVILLLLSMTLVTDPNKRFVLVSVCIVGLVTHPRYYLYTLLQDVNRLKEYSHIVITERSISIVISIFALLLGCKDFKLIIAFDVIGRILSFLIAVNYCKQIVFKKPHIDICIIRKAYKYVVSGIMILFAMQTSSIVIGVSRYGIERKWGIEEFSKISLAIALSNMVLRCVNSISVVMFPTLRNIENKKLPHIYEELNTILMSAIYIMMCFYKPLCYIVGLWLPQYANTLKYSVLILPICIYECKYSLIINTYLKNFRKEKMIGVINALTVLLSAVMTTVSIFVIQSIEAAVIGVLLSLATRCMIGEIVVGRLLKIHIVKNIVSEFIFAVAFVICQYYFNTIISYVFFIELTLIFIISERKRLLKIISGVLRKS